MILRPGELRTHERFGPETVNRGAVLWECEWDGGVFEAGVMLGGVFRSGEFRGGVFWGAFWRGGSFSGGFWHNGFGPDGRYRPRGAGPLADPPARNPAESASAQDAPEDRLLTVFAASVYPDIARLWLSCIRRALPADSTRVEVFDDSAEGVLFGAGLTDVRILRPTAERRDFQEAYNDAVARTTTPLLAFVDTDVFWVRPDVWKRVQAELAPGDVASVSCVSRAAAESHGTFAVVLKTAAYRDVLRTLPGGFFPFVEREAEGSPPGRWIGHDTGDLATRAVRAAGFDVKLLHLDSEGDFVRFDAITNTRRIGEWTGSEILLSMAETNPYFRRGCLGNLALKRVHDRLFVSGPRYEAPLSGEAVRRGLLRHPRTFLRALGEASRFRSEAGRIERFVLQGRETASA